MPSDLPARADSYEEKFIRDVLTGAHDLVGLADAHHLSLHELATMMTTPKLRDCLAGLCRLGDLQARVVASRYRLFAVLRLAEQIMDHERELSAEQVRKVCADLLKIDVQLDSVIPDHDKDAIHDEHQKLIDVLTELRQQLRDENSTHPAV